MHVGPRNIALFSALNMSASAMSVQNHVFLFVSVQASAVHFIIFCFEGDDVVPTFVLLNLFRANL